MVEVDLHVHTTASDGEYPAEEVVAAAKRMGLKALAVTDHDSVDGLEAALAAGEREGLEVISGVEISCVYRGDEVHILGYYIDTLNPRLKETLLELRKSRHDRLEQMVLKAKYIGFSLKPDDIEFDGVPGRAHFARALVRKGYARDMNEAFSRYLRLGGPLYVDRYSITPGEILELIRDAKGVSSLAHPGLLHEKKLVGEMVAFGVEGLEIYYPLHSKNQIKEFRALAVKHSLAVTGGSDYHGPKTNSVRLGAAGIRLEQLEELKSRIKI